MKISRKNYAEQAMSQRAKKAGLVLEKGYQRYMHHGWGFVNDDHGNRIIGYQLFDCEQSAYVYGSYDEIRTHCLTTLNEVSEMIDQVANEKRPFCY